MLKHSRIYSFAAGIAFALAGTSALAAKDLNRLLEGEYTYAGTGYCVGSLLGFNENFQAVFGSGGGTFVNSHNVNGVIVFNGDGTGTFSARSMSVSAGGASANDFTGDVTYELASDMTITIVNGPSTTTPVVPPPPVGAPGSVSGTAPFTGRVSDDLRTIVVLSSVPAVETVFTNGVRQPDRICTRQRTFLKLQK